MAFNYLLYYSVILCWGINIFFLVRFARAWHEQEPEKLNAWLAMAALAAVAVGLTVFLPARGGYDNNHDFMCLGQRFFTKDPFVMLQFKELSPLFTDGISDLLSGNSLSAILWKNRLLQAASIFVFFTGLRRLGASLLVSAASAAFLFLNFLSPLNASSFATTSSNMLIWLISLLAIFDAYAARDPGPAALAWIISSLVLAMSARMEFFPVNLLLIAAFAAAKTRQGSRFLFNTANLAVVAAGACLTWAWGLHSIGFHPSRQLGMGIHPLQALIYQLGVRNLAVIGGIAPDWPGLRMIISASPASPSAILCWLLLIALLAGIAAGCRADRPGAKTRLAALAVAALWIGYFSAIYAPLDFYPLHFMRHQLYFFLPFAYLFALGLSGFERAAARPGARRVLGALCLAAMTVYAGLNAKAALGLNGALRTNDRELDLLMKAQRDWPAGCVAVHPVRNRQNTRADLIQKYFPTTTDCRQSDQRCLLKYVSPEPFIFSNTETDPLEQAPLLPGKPGTARKAVSFPHAFYTAYAGQITETTDAVPLTIGFFNMEETGRDRALLETLSGVCTFDSGDSRGAAEKFKRAVTSDPSCLNCRYLLALSYAAERKKGAAQAELAAIEKLSHTKLSPELRTLLGHVERGEVDQADVLARKISDTRPEFFFRKNFSRWLQELEASCSGVTGTQRL